MAKKPKVDEVEAAPAASPVTITPLATINLLINGVTVRLKAGVPVAATSDIMKALEGSEALYATD